MRTPSTVAHAATPALLLITMAVSGCKMPSSGGETKRTSPAVLQASDGRLEIRAGFPRGIKMERQPMRTIELTFKNTSKSLLRVFLPKAEAFRTNISTLLISSGEGGSTLMVPEPRPHGYVISEADFLLLAPGEERMIPQPFTIDSVQPDSGNVTARMPGFETGKTVQVRWRYENKNDIWPGGERTMEGVTKPLFNGKPVPHIWTGELLASGEWTIADP